MAESSGNNNRLFIDGTKLKEANVLNGRLTSTSAGSLIFGKIYPAAADVGHTFKGSMDRLRFYSRAITDAEVTALFTQDSDYDGFPDYVEKNWTGRKAMSASTFQGPGEDTDDDAIPDGWEIANGQNPLSATGRDGADADNDSDGLSNFDEYQNLTNPNNADTDGDGKNDGAETTQGSNPTSATDQGLPPADPLETVKFTLGGDYTTWEMTIKGLGPRDTRSMKIASKDFSYNFTSQTRKLHKNNKYEVTMKYLRTIPNQAEPWFCWQAQIDDWPPASSPSFESPSYQIGPRTPFNQSNLLKNHWIIDNQPGLLTSHIHSKGPSGNKAGSLKALLLPVDIDIIHPATGELSEGDEDSTSPAVEKGKGGLVAIRRNIETPLTKLVLRAVPNLPSTSKFRLNVVSSVNSGSLKIWKDQPCTQPVVSQQTEFDMGAETTLFLEGVKPGSGGDLKIYQETNVGGTWLPSDKVSIAVVHSEIELILRCFIPHKWTDAEAPIPVAITYTNSFPNVIPVLVTTSTIAGDRQPLSVANYVDEPLFRLSQMLVMTPYKEIHSQVDIASKRRRKAAPLTEYYKKSEDIPATAQNATFGEALVAGATPNWSYAPDPNPTANYFDARRSGDVSKLTVSLSGGPGTAPFVTDGLVPNIDWEYTISMTRIENGNNPFIRVKVDGNHNLYPAYEVIAQESDGTFVPIYQVKPLNATLPGPYSLNVTQAANGSPVDLH